METKRTKGEWKVSYNTTAHLPYSYVISDEQESDDEAEANAKLIASAPELLEALIKLYGAIDSCIDLTPELLKNCKNAIKKATE